MFLIVVLGLLSLSVKAQHYNQRLSYLQNYPYGYQDMQQNQLKVRGNLLSSDTFMLPTGSQIIVSLVDVGLRHAVPQRINTIVLRDSYHFPIPFEIPYSISQLQTNSNSIQQYAIQAQIEQDDKLLYINDQYTPVQLIPASHNPINIMMKNVDASPTRNNGEIYTTRAPSVNNMHICLQIPEIGPCRARIEQYYFDAQLGSCQIFYWGGCVGNQNRFNSRDECESTCWFNRRQETTNDIKQIYTS